MLSKIGILIAGLIAEKPLNPYEIQKFFELTDFNKIYLISTSSIYATINGLVKRGFIAGIKVKNGKMPDKTIYSITKKGQNALKESLTKHLCESEYLFSEFDISMAFICHLDKEDAIEALEKHRLSIEKILSESHEDFKKVKKEGLIPYTGLTRRKHHLYKREAELRTINEFIQLIKEDDDWNHFPASEWLM